MKKLIFLPFVIYDYIYNKVLLKFKKVSYNPCLEIYGRLMITGRGKLILGKNVIFNSSRRANHIGEASRTIFKLSGADASVIIGNNTGISNTTFVCRAGITVGEHVKMGGGVKLYDSDAHSLDHKIRMDRSIDVGVKKPIHVKDHAFIGAYSIILKGVTIGERSIIGAGSVVTKNVPDGEIWAGNPAKFIKKL